MVEKSEPRKIPSHIRRKVRQRCGFGCVICGLPLYEYDHILGFARVQRHLAEEITLLCDKHHRERTHGLLPTEVVVAANDAPYNLRSNASHSYKLHYSGNDCYVEIGSNRFAPSQQIHELTLLPIVIDNFAPLAFTFQDGNLLFSAELHDEHNRVILSIVDNELVYSTNFWDIEFIGKNLVIRTGQRSIFIDITFEPPTGIRVNRGRLLHSGVEVIVDPDWLSISGTGHLVHNFSALGTVGFALGDYSLGVNAGMHIAVIPRQLRNDPSGSYSAARKKFKEADIRLKELRERLKAEGFDPDRWGI